MQRILYSLAACLFLGACAPSMTTPEPVMKGPPVQNLSGPYDHALACLQAIPEVRGLRIAVSAIEDRTGKYEIAEGGTGAFVTQDASDMFNTALDRIGVNLIVVSEEYRKVTDWFASRGVQQKIAPPQFLLTGSITNLDFEPGWAVEAGAYSVGLKHRQYRARVGLNVQLATFADGNTPGGYVYATSEPNKQFAARVSEAGLGTFIGAASGLTFGSFRIANSDREPMQYALGYMVDYAAAELVGKLVIRLSNQGKIPNRRSMVAGCFKHLEPEAYQRNTQVAAAT